MAIGIGWLLLFYCSFSFILCYLDHIVQFVLLDIQVTFLFATVIVL